MTSRSLMSLCKERFKLHSAQMRLGERLQPHKMKWELEWAISMRQSGTVSLSSFAVLTQLWRTLGLTNVFLTMPHWFSSLHGWAVIVMVQNSFLHYLQTNLSVVYFLLFTNLLELQVIRGSHLRSLEMCACWLEWWQPISTITKLKIWCLRFLSLLKIYSFLGFPSIRSSWFIIFFLGSCLCGVALMSFVPRLMRSTGTQGKMLQNIT